MTDRAGSPTLVAASCLQAGRGRCASQCVLGCKKAEHRTHSATCCNAHPTFRPFDFNLIFCSLCLLQAASVWGERNSMTRMQSDDGALRQPLQPTAGKLEQQWCCRMTSSPLAIFGVGLVHTQIGCFPLCSIAYSKAVSSSTSPADHAI